MDALSTPRRSTKRQGSRFRLRNPLSRSEYPQRTPLFHLQSPHFQSAHNDGELWYHIREKDRQRHCPAACGRGIVAHWSGRVQTGPLAEVAGEHPERRRQGSGSGGWGEGDLQGEYGGRECASDVRWDAGLVSSAVCGRVLVF